MGLMQRFPQATLHLSGLAAVPLVQSWSMLQKTGAARVCEQFGKGGPITGAMRMVIAARASFPVLASSFTRVNKSMSFVIGRLSDVADEPPVV